MQRILYYDCFAGISGDMNLGALIHLGVDPDYLKTELKKLNIDGFKS
jgi:pyridinium-3,5-bisthiocarboxylic acid mononucleotide nickel chelatase